MYKTLVVMMIPLLLIVGCNNRDSNQSEQSEQSSSIESVNATVQDTEGIATNLKVPWDIIQTGEGFFISQRGGTIIKVRANGEKTEMPLQLERDVVHRGEGGLLGFVLHPNYAQNQNAYVYHTYEEQGRRQNRVVLLKQVNQSWEEQKVLLEGIPGSNIHNGGRLEIGPDQKLYVSTGDAAQESNAQDLNSLSGKILRMNLDGSIPSDNPFNNSYIYSYGHRNPQGMTWSEDGTMYAAEHGSRAYDEINLIKPGANYGWPVIRGNEQKEGMETPLFHSGENTWAPSGLTYQNGHLYMAGLRGEQIREFDLEQKSSRVFVDGVGRVRDILFDENDMYFITNNTDGRGTPRPNDDKLIKVVLKQES
ncbi:PQQ-dependent sugar dehydrogenase [Pontibacillus marinus]|uniref:Quinoprotein glucose dehydrogenase n=1 Tax=Pontibacillus marinus BH030004 = DSM 16465 TaxID=1385511 RepID=A0A0A5FUH1_9BACI|nr:PQQ-dependent sugar dehydrogenase [Pontibacillus marinus]KGX83519.1 quinoprotein glucose dehydrogenase [Pontibacillus marinus BH030004 = DSM 16465]